MTTGPLPATPASLTGSIPNVAAEFALRDFYRQEFERIRRDFEATGSGLASLSDRTRAVDKLTLTLWDRQFAVVGKPGYTLIALGGYGRSELFPFSDVDLLFLTEDETGRETIKDEIRGLCQSHVGHRAACQPGDPDSGRLRPLRPE